MFCSAVFLGVSKKAPFTQAWTDLQSHASQPVDRNQLAASLLQSLFGLLAGYELTGFSGWRSRWQARGYLNEQLVVVTGPQPMEGVAVGVDEQGALLIQTDRGVRAVIAGDASVRRQVS